MPRRQLPDFFQALNEAATGDSEEKRLKKALDIISTRFVTAMLSDVTDVVAGKLAEDRDAVLTFDVCTDVIKAGDRVLKCKLSLKYRDPETGAVLRLATDARIDKDGVLK